MVPVEWPIAAADLGDGQLPARAAGGDRLRVIRADFFLDPQARLTEQERALMTSMLSDLVASVGDDFAVLLGAAEPANDGEAQLFDQLWKAGLLDIPDLLRLLLRRAEHERLSAALRSGRGGTGSRFLQSFVGHDDSDVSAAAMSLILALGRRRDRFESPRLLFDDLSAEAAVALVNAVAAVLRQDLVKRFDSADADDRLSSASRALLGRHDEGNRVEARLFELVHALERAGRLDENFVRSAFEAGEVALVAEALGRQAGIGFDSAWDQLIGMPGQLPLLLRMSGASRALAGEIVGGLAEIAASNPETEMALFDGLSQEEVERSRNWLRLDPAYRQAISVLAANNGQPSF